MQFSYLFELLFAFVYQLDQFQFYNLDTLLCYSPGIEYSLLLWGSKGTLGSKGTFFLGSKGGSKGTFFLLPPLLLSAIMEKKLKA